MSRRVVDVDTGDRVTWDCHVPICSQVLTVHTICFFIFQIRGECIGKWLIRQESGVKELLGKQGINRPFARPDVLLKCLSN